jgi:DivIVA domain-containing protein
VTREILGLVEDDVRGAPSEHESEEPPVPKTGLRPARGRTFLPDVTGVEFSSSRRGYDRAQVDDYVERVSRIVVELEAMRSPDALIERALADVGEETSAILRRARKAAEEIVADAEDRAREMTDAAEAQGREIREQADHHSSQVRAEAEEVLAQAREHAGQVSDEAAADARRVREEADGYQERVSAHIEQLAQERHRLIEDLRQLADHFHRTADRALEQIPSQRQSQDAVDGDGAASHSRTA